MKPSTLYSWERLDDRGSLLWLKYWWGPASANTLAYRQNDGSWAVVSPASGASPAVFDALAGLGPVTSLIAPNGYHYLGQKEWRARFPQATSYAPAGAIGRLNDKLPGVPFNVLEQSRSQLGPAEFLVPNGMKTPDALFNLPLGDKWFWWLGDQFSNNAKDDQTWVFRILSRILANGPGFYCNPKPGLIYVADKDAWAASMREALIARPPDLVLCAHGNPVVEAVARRSVEAIGRVVPTAG